MIHSKGLMLSEQGLTRFILIGLSKDDTDKITTGPLLILGKDMGIPYDIVLLWEETDEALKKAVEEAVSSGIELTFGARRERPHD